MSPKPFIVRDRYFWKAKTQGLRARSAFKLEEIQQKYHFVRNGDRVLDLGAAPGGFLQLLQQWVGLQGSVFGVDLTPIAHIGENVTTTVQDIFDLPGMTKVFGTKKFSIITSDLAPKTTGIKEIDQERSVELNEQAVLIAHHFLQPGGHLLLKIFRGQSFDPFLKKLRPLFRDVHCIKPQASRDRSREIYILGLGFKAKNS